MNYTVIIVIGYDDIWISSREEFAFARLEEAEAFAEKMRRSNSEELKKYCCTYEEIEDEIIDGNEQLESEEYTCWIAQYITDGDPDQCVESHWAEEIYENIFSINSQNEIVIFDDWCCIENNF